MVKQAFALDQPNDAKYGAYLKSLKNLRRFLKAMVLILPGKDFQLLIGTS